MPNSYDPFRIIAYANAIRSPCILCGDEITIHDMLGNQVIAANDGGSKQAHRYCWENKERMSDETV